MAATPPFAGPLAVTPFPHPQGCRAWLVADPDSREALVVDPHLDQVDQVARHAAGSGLRLRWIVDTHTHADHPSGAAALAAGSRAVRVAHARAAHAGARHHPEDGETLALGDRSLQVRHAPGHTPDHLVLVGAGALFSGDSLLIGAVARTDFLGGDAGVLYDSIHAVTGPLADDTRLLPGHDYEGRTESTLGQERRTNPWLAIADRDAFARALAEGAPPEPANMETLLRLNREGRAAPAHVSAAEVVEVQRRGGEACIIDVRTPEEVEAAHVPGSRHILLDTLPVRLDEVRATPAPRLILCRVGNRAELARRFLAAQGIGAVATIVGGIEALVRAGGAVRCGRLAPPAAGGACAARPGVPSGD